MSAPTTPADPQRLADRIAELSLSALATGRERVLIGICGAPGSGKSTFAAAVVAAIGPAAILVGMDGYHLAQSVLDAAGSADRKGAPDTFDAAGFVALVRRLADPVPGETVYAPEFDRGIEQPIAGAVPVPPDARVVVLEGNYLLLDVAPWDQLPELLDETWYLDTVEALRTEWLVSRHIAFGRTPQVAQERATGGTDARNAIVVRASRDRADLLLV